jgi:hemerythrin-like domain-containing protein
MTDPYHSAFPLGDRQGLPDDIAVLRAHFPRADWRGHANFGELAAFWLQVHASLRHEGSEVSRIVDEFRHRRIADDQFQRGFVSRLNGFLGHLDQHHRIEDDAYFPRFRQLDDRMVIGFDLLESDHRLIHQRLIAMVEQARGLLTALSASGDDGRRAADGFAVAATRFVTLLEQHLADEEELVIPALLQHGERPLR